MVERRPERDLRVQTPDLERGARVHFADFISLYKIRRRVRNQEGQEEEIIDDNRHLDPATARDYQGVVKVPRLF